VVAKEAEKREAIRLRKEGKTYSEILDVVSVSKSTLSLWLRKVELSTPQKQIFSAKKRAAARRGGEARYSARVRDEEEIVDEALKEVGSLSRREKWLLGVALYWGEGSKQKSHNVSQGVELINDDFRLITFFLEWLNLIGVAQHDLIFELYIHESSRTRREEVLKYWSHKLSLKKRVVVRVYYKKHKTKGYRRKLLSEYFGSMRVKVRSSTRLNRRIAGWTMGIVENCPIV
jgi:Homeodomain-like domain